MLLVGAVAMLQTKPQGQATAHTTDTLTITKFDTIIKYKPAYITKKVVDTLRITDTIYLVREQKHFQEKDVYDIWISGYEPTLDSAKVYPRVVYKTINNTTYKEQPKKWEAYWGGGINTISGTLIPHLDISIATPRNVIISANFGLYDGFNYGFTIQKKIQW